MRDILPKMLDFNAVLRDFQYKPNFSYGAYEREDKPWIRVIMLVENARVPFLRWEVSPDPQDNNLHWLDSYSLPPARNGVGWSPSRELIEIVGNYPIPMSFFPGDEKRFIDWMVTIIRRMEDHETFEWLRYKGELINDPHKEV